MKAVIAVKTPLLPTTPLVRIFLHKEGVFAVFTVMLMWTVLLRVLWVEGAFSLLSLLSLPRAPRAKPTSAAAQQHITRLAQCTQYNLQTGPHWRCSRCEVRATDAYHPLQKFRVEGSYP